MKKILSLILALIMMLSCASMIFADDAVLSDEAPVEVDETASAYYEAVQFLVAYDIMHGKGEGVLGVYDDIQRYEMALFMGRILTGWTDDSTWEDGILNSSEFTDLAGTAAEKFYGAISYVNQKGVIEGYGNGKFGPTDGITYQDALTMAVRALGYKDLAYPWGYIETAINLGLDDGITGVVFTDTLKREVVAQIIYNTLFATNKAGTTLAESVFDLSIAWTNIIITKTDIASGDVPAGYVGFSVLYDDGTIGEETYYVEAADLGLVGEHDDELAWGAAYKVMFETKANLGLNTVIAYEALELETIKNEGIYSMTTAGYPIQAFLADYDIVTNYSVKTYLNSTPEIILTAADNILGLEEIDAQIGVDWATGNIIYFDYSATKPVYTIACMEYEKPSTLTTFVTDTLVADGKCGLVAQKSADWCIVNPNGTSYATRYVCQSCGGDVNDADQWYDFHDASYTCNWLDEVCVDIQYQAVSEVLWYYNALIDSYFQLQLKETVNGVEIVGVYYMTAAERAELDTLLNLRINADWEVLNKITKVESDADKLNAYASLRLFDITGDDAADYGFYEEYRFGIFTNTTVKCAKCNDGKGAVVPAFAITDISNTPIDGAVNTWVVANEANCAHDSAWLSGAESVADGTYVIYGYNAATGELKIVKTITQTYEENEDDYIGHAYLRSYNVANNRLVLNGEKLSYNYPQLKGSITEAMTLSHKDWTGANPGFPAIASRYLNTLLGQYIEYVVVDGKIAYIELEGASENLIVVEKYAGIHEDGTIVVWGYEVGADKDVTKLEQFRINSYNGWANGDWYNYSFYNEAEIEAAFTRGAVYQVKSYDPDVKAYNVQILTSAGEDYNYAQYGTWTELYYADAKVGGMSVGTKAAGGEIERKMTSADKYVFIYDIEGDETYNAIPIVTYTGIVSNPDAYAKGYRVGDTDGTYIMYIDDRADINGFAGAADQGYGLVMFLEWGTEANYDAANGKNYLVGSMVRTAWVFDLYTYTQKEITVYPGNYVKATWWSTEGSLNDGYNDKNGGEMVYIERITGPVYQTVNGVLVNDEPVDAKDIPHIFEETVKGTDIIADADNMILETGKVIVKWEGEKLDRSRIYDLGFDNKVGGDFEGLNPYSINQRMTLKALGTAYHTLSPYTLFITGKARVIVGAIRVEANGYASIQYCGSSSDKNGSDAYGRIAWNSMGKYSPESAWSAGSLLDYFGDSGNTNQAYNYSLIYNSDISNTGAAKNDASRAVVYFHDTYNDPALTDKATFSANGYMVSGVDGFNATDYAEGSYNMVPLKTDRAKADWQAMADAYEAANGLEAGSVCIYDGFDDGRTTGKNGAGLNAGVDYNNYKSSAFQFVNKDFTFSVWVKANEWHSSDPAILGTQDWSSGSNKGFVLVIAGDDKQTIQFCMGDYDGRGDSIRAKAEGLDLDEDVWYNIVVTYDLNDDYVLEEGEQGGKKGGTAKIYLNGEKVAEATNDSLWNEETDGNALKLGWDGPAKYGDRLDCTLDEFLLVNGVWSAEDVAAFYNANK